MTKHAGFSEHSLRQDIVNTWGPAGAHVDVFDHMLAEVTRLEADRENWLTWTPERLDNVQRTAGLRHRLNVALAENATLREALEAILVLDDRGSDAAASHRFQDAKRIARAATPTATAREGEPSE